MIKKIANNIVSVGAQSGFEGITEGLQEIIGNAIEQTYNENADLFKGVDLAVVVGSIFGGLADVGVSGVNLITGKKQSYDEAIETINQNIEKALTTHPNKRTEAQKQLVDAILTKEYTPEEAGGLVIKNGIEKTDIGKEIIKATVQASEEGKNIKLVTDQQTGNITVELVDRESVPEVIRQEIQATETAGGVKSEGKSETLTPSNVTSEEGTSLPSVSTARTTPSPSTNTKNLSPSTSYTPGTSKSDVLTDSSFIDIYNNITAEKNYLEGLLKEIAENRDFVVSVKNKETAAEKIIRKLRRRSEFKATDLEDLVRGRIIAKDNSDKQFLLNEIKARANVVQVIEHTGENNAWGYEGTNIWIRTPKGYLNEIQLHTPESMFIMEKTRAIYDKWRGKDVPNTVLEKSRELAKEARAEYNQNKKAYDEVKEGMKQKSLGELQQKPQERKTARKVTKAKVEPFAAKKILKPESEDFAKETDKIIKRSEIAKRLAKVLNVPIRHGKFRYKGQETLGIFKADKDIIRIKAPDIRVVAHEVGHFFNHNIDEFSVKNLQKFIDELNAVAEETEYGIGNINESFAEFISLWTIRPAQTIKLAPKLNEYFQRTLEKYPEIEEVMLATRRDALRWEAMPATAKVFSQISMKEPKNSFTEQVGQTVENLYTAAKDDLYPISKVSNIMKEELKAKNLTLEATNDPYILARTFRGWVGKADIFLTKGTFERQFWKEENGKIKPAYTGKSLQEILKPVEKKGALDDLRVYLVARRVIELNKREKPVKTGIDVDDAIEAVAELDRKYPEFKLIAQELYTYQDAVTKYAFQSGLFDKKNI